MTSFGDFEASSPHYRASRLSEQVFTTTLSYEEALSLVLDEDRLRTAPNQVDLPGEFSLLNRFAIEPISDNDPPQDRYVGLFLPDDTMRESHEMFMTLTYCSLTRGERLANALGSLLRRQPTSALVNMEVVVKPPFTA